MSTVDRAVGCGIALALALATADAALAQATTPSADPSAVPTDPTATSIVPTPGELLNQPVTPLDPALVAPAAPGSIEGVPRLPGDDASGTGQTNAAVYGRTSSEERPSGFGGITALGAILTRGFDISGSLRTVYDDNILKVSDDRVLTEGRSRADFRFTPSVTARIGQPIGRQQLYASVLLGYDFYARNTELDRSRILANAGVNLRAGSRCAGNAAFVFSRRQNTLTEVDEVVDSAVERRSYNAEASCGGAIGLGYGASFDHTVQDNSREERQAFDSEDTTVGARVFYSSPSLGQLSLSGTYVDTVYPNRPAVGFSIDFDQNPPVIIQIPLSNGTRRYIGTLNYSRTIGSRLQASAGVSYIVTDPTSTSGGAVGDNSGNVGFSGSLVYRPGPRLTIGVEGNRSVNSTANVGALFVIDTDANLDINYRVNSKLTAAFNASVGDREYRQPFNTNPDALIRESQTIYRVSGALTFRPNRLFDVDFELAHQKRDSNPAIFDYKSTLAAITLRVNL